MLRKALLVAALALVPGCATYHPRPLDRDVVDAGLRPPDADSVSVAVEKLEHPLLPRLVFDPGDGLSLDEAAVLAVVANPELRAVRAQRGVARAQVIEAGVLPNPQLDVSADFPSGDGSGTTTATGFGLSLDLERLFTRGPERASARAQLRSVQLDVAWKEWQVAEHARLQACRQIFLERRLDVAREEEEALRSNRDELERAAARQLVTEAERAAASDAFRTARDTRLQIEAQLEVARRQLARVLGQPPPTTFVLQARGVPFLPSGGATDSVAVPMPDVATVPDDSLVARLERWRLDLVALRLGYESQEEALHAAVRRSFPSITLGVNRLVDTSNVLTWGPALTLGLPFFDRNQGEVAVGRATREQLREEYFARVFSARADVADLRQQIQHLRLRLANAEESLPDLAHLVDLYGRALRQGTVDALLYYDARSRKTGKQLEVLRLRQDLAELAVGLETATGGLWTFATGGQEE